MFNGLTDSKRIARIQAKVDAEYYGDTSDLKLKLMEILLLDELITAVENSRSQGGVGLNQPSTVVKAPVPHS